MVPSASAEDMVELSSKEPRLGISTAIVVAIAMTALASGLGAGITPAFASADPPVVKTRRALDFLGQAAFDWQNQFGCSGCHKQAMTIAALGTARSRGYDAAKPGIIQTLIDGLLTLNSGQQPDGCFTLNNGPDSTEATTFGGRGLEAYDRYFRPKKSNLLAAADCLLSRQASDGRLASDHTELPVAQGDFITTAHGIFTWNRSFELTGNTSYSNAANRAVSWLRGRVSVIQAAPDNFTTQDKAMLLAGLGGSGAGTSDSDVVSMRNLVASEQQADGSWKLRNSETGGNGHATGQVVFALRECGYTRSDSAVDRGTQWLFDHQQGDGSWAPDSWEGNPPSQIAPSMWGALALATYASPLNGLRVAPISGTAGGSATVSWNPVDGASSYDLIRGNVAALTELSDHVDLGPAACLAAATPSTSFQDGQNPSAGQSFFYLMRIRWDSTHDIYGRSSGGRDRIPSSGDCPP